MRSSSTPSAKPVLRERPDPQVTCSNDFTEVEGVSPLRRANSTNDSTPESDPWALCPSRCQITRTPLPCMGCTYASSASIETALRRVLREQPYCAVSSLSVGRKSS